MGIYPPLYKQDDNLSERSDGSLTPTLGSDDDEEEEDSESDDDAKNCYCVDG